MIYYKQMYVSKRLGVSSTAIEIINGRWAMDKFDLRRDPATVKLFDVLPNTTALGHWLVLFPLYLLKVIAGENLIYPTFKEAKEATLANLVTTRTIYFDQLLEKSLQTSEQFVVMGAGLDTRCYGRMAKDHIALFELDQAQTQELKKDYLDQANIDTTNVNFVSVDFKSESWFEKLCVAGFDKDKVTTFLWEGVTLYLSEEDVRSTLGEIKNNVAHGSAVVTDFYANEFVNGDLFPGKKKSTDQLKMTNEMMDFGVVFEKASSPELQSLIKSEGMKLGQGHYMGSETKKGTWMAVVEILYSVANPY